jgi:hypothetical protein
MIARCKKRTISYYMEGGMDDDEKSQANKCNEEVTSDT